MNESGELAGPIGADLLVAGESILRMPPTLMAFEIGSITKTFTALRSPQLRQVRPIDVMAVARASHRGQHLPLARLDQNGRAGRRTSSRAVGIETACFGLP
jgi:hypothetical protein